MQGENKNDKPGKGFFITFEGPEGSGKTTQIKSLREFFLSKNYSVVLTREPGGTEAGDRIRSLLLDDGASLEPETELLLMLAQRVEHFFKVIKPAVESNKVVLCDRYFDSSMAYQGYGHGLDPEGIRRIHKDFICNYLPDLTVLLLLAPEEGLLRASHGGSKKLDRMESQNIEFHSRVFKGYQKLAEIEPERFITVDAEDSAENISAKITEEICKRLEV